MSGIYIKSSFFCNLSPFVLWEGIQHLSLSVSLILRCITKKNDTVLGGDFLSISWTEIAMVHDILWKTVKVSSVWLSETAWTIAYQAPLSMEFSRQEYWSGLPFPSPGDLPNQRIEPRSPTLQVDSLPSESPGKPKWYPMVLLFAAFPLENRTLPTGGSLSSTFPMPSLAVLWAPNAPQWVMGALVKVLNLGTSVQKDFEYPIHIYIRKALAIMDLSVHIEADN